MKKSTKKIDINDNADDDSEFDVPPALIDDDDDDDAVQRQPTKSKGGKSKSKINVITDDSDNEEMTVDDAQKRLTTLLKEQKQIHGLLQQKKISKPTAVETQGKLLEKINFLMSFVDCESSDNANNKSDRKRHVADDLVELTSSVSKKMLKSVEGGPSKGYEVINLSAPQIKRPGRQIRINDQWSVETNHIPLKKNVGATFEVFSFRRESKKEKNEQGKPFVFSMPIRLLSHFVNAIVELEKESKASYVSNVTLNDMMEHHKTLTKENGGDLHILDMRNIDADDIELKKRKVFRVETFELAVGTVQYGSGNGVVSFDALVITKTCAGEKKESFSISIPVRLVPAVRVALAFLQWERNNVDQTPRSSDMVGMMQRGIRGGQCD